MELILRDEFGNEVTIKKPELETWTDFSREFVKALEILEFSIPNSFREYLDKEDEKLTEI